MHDDDVTDDALRQQLRAADPARALAPLPSTWLDHRMEQIMNDTRSPTAHREAETAKAHRG